MAEAEVGDDVYGEDPTVNRLEERGAKCSARRRRCSCRPARWATRSRSAVLTRRGDEVLVERRSHVVRYELSGMSVLSGVMPRMVDAPGGHLTPAGRARRGRAPSVLQVRRAPRRPREHAQPRRRHGAAGRRGAGRRRRRARVRLRACTSTGRGCGTRRSRSACRRRASSRAPTPSWPASPRACALRSAPSLASSRERIEEARRVRKLLGGGMRQAGVLAAAGLVALETMVERLAEDHANAQLLAAALGGRRGVAVSPGRDEHRRRVSRGARRARRRRRAPRARASSATAMDGRTLRFVTHHDVAARRLRAGGGRDRARPRLKLAAPIPGSRDRLVRPCGRGARPSPSRRGGG